ncbi:hypothetical protein CRUP_019600 [Coryphaenoides rupestris]|nr:hypothetical protein CRUP_019600 [Coryphaenoides rupestris]
MVLWTHHGTQPVGRSQLGQVSRTGAGSTRTQAHRHQAYQDLDGSDTGEDKRFLGQISSGTPRVKEFFWTNTTFPLTSFIVGMPELTQTRCSGATRSCTSRLNQPGSDNSVADARSQLQVQGPGLALEQGPTVQGHAVMGPGN